MKLVTNPFSVSYSDVPSIYIETPSMHECMFDILTGSISESYFITGVRGSGKTVMMNRIIERLMSTSEKKLGYKFCHIELLSNDDMLTSLYNQLIDQSRRLRVDLKGVSFGVPGLLTVSVNTEHPSVSSTQPVIIEMLRRLAKRNVHVLISIDEVSVNKAIPIFGQLFNLIKSEHLPVLVLMTGLPEMIDKIKNMQNLTFLYRAPKVYTDMLDISKMAQAYSDNLHCPFSYGIKLAKISMGYPYAFQLLGSLLFKQVYVRDCGLQPTWNDNLIRSIMDDFQSQLFADAYEKLYTELPAQEQYYLSYVKLGQHTSQMAKAMGWTIGHTGRYRALLLKRRLIQPAGYGMVTFTLPCFANYIKATKTEESVYYLGDE